MIGLGITWGFPEDRYNSRLHLKKDDPKRKKLQSNEEYYADLAEDFLSKLKTKVTFKKNSFTVGYKNEQELNRILEEYLILHRHHVRCRKWEELENNKRTNKKEH